MLPSQFSSVFRQFWLRRCTYYEFFTRDGFLVIGKGHAVHEEGEDGLMGHITETGRIEKTDLQKSPSCGVDNKYPKTEHFDIYS